MNKALLMSADEWWVITNEFFLPGLSKPLDSDFRSKLDFRFNPHLILLLRINFGDRSEIAASEWRHQFAYAHSNFSFAFRNIYGH